MATISRSIDAMQKAEEVLQDIANEVTIEWFTGTQSDQQVKTGRRMLDIGALLYDKPRDFLHICLWEALAAAYPVETRNAVGLRALFRPAAWNVAESVYEHTTWDQFEFFVLGDTPAGGPLMGPKIVPIH